MRKLSKIIAALAILSLSFQPAWGGVVDTLRFPAPCIDGLVTAVDAGDLTNRQCANAVNIDVQTKMGELRFRYGLKYYGMNDTTLFGLTGVHSEYPAYKQLWGVTNHSDSALLGVGKFCYSNRNEAELSDNFITTPIYPALDFEHRFVQWRDIAIHTDGKSIPSYFSSVQTYFTTDSTEDSLGYGPHVYSLGLEAPGQLRYTVTSTSGGNSKKRRYSYAYLAGTSCDPDTWSATVSGDMALPSAWCFSESKRVVLSLFTNRPNNSCDSARVLVLRQYEGDIWRVLDTIAYDDADGAVYFVDSITTAIDSFALSAVADTIPRPGQLWLNDSTAHIASFWKSATASALISVDVLTSYYVDSFYITSASTPVVVSYTRTLSDNSTADIARRMRDAINTAIGDTVTVTSDGSSYRVVFDQSNQVYGMTPFIRTDTFQTVTGYEPIPYNRDTVKVAYTYYDPVTGFESPLGPALTTVPVNILDSSSVDTSAWGKVVAKDQSKAERPKWIRVYVNPYPELDSGAYYGVAQFRANRLENGNQQTMTLGNWTDSSIVFGLDSASMTVYTAHPFNFWYNAAGYSPLYTSDASIVWPFSDITIANRIGYAIGDPEHPNRLYYSQQDSLGTWRYYENIDENPNDVLVALEPAPGTQGLWAAKNNRLYLINAQIPFAPSYDYNDAIVSSKVGAVSRSAVTRIGDQLFFLGSDLRGYMVSGSSISEISRVVEPTFLSTFGGLGTALDRARVWAMGDDVYWMDDSTQIILTYDTRKPTEQAWRLTDFGGLVVPRGITKYDTLSTLRGFAYSKDVMYFEGSYKLQAIDSSHKYDIGYLYGIKFTLPEIGDGLRDVSIREVIMDVEIPDSTSAIFNVYDAEGDELDEQKRWIGPNAEPFNLRTAFEPHWANRVAFHFEAYPRTAASSFDPPVIKNILLVVEYAAPARLNNYNVVPEDPGGAVPGSPNIE